MPRLCPFSLMLVLAVSSPAFGDRPSQNAKTGEEANDVGDGTDLVPYSGPPCCCLQQKWIDNPGPFDVYICLTYYGPTCTNPVEEQWFGQPTNPNLPQICQNRTCESLEEERKGESGMPGHGLDLTAQSAWEMIQPGLQAAGQKLKAVTPEYHMIPSDKIPEKLGIKGDILVMAVPTKVTAKNSPLEGKTFYLCLQIDSAEENQITAANMDDGEPRRGRQFAINYKVDGEQRRGLVWLK